MKALDLYVDSELTDLLAQAVEPDPRDHRDRGRFLTPRLYAWAKESM